MRLLDKLFGKKERRTGEDKMAVLSRIDALNMEIMQLEEQLRAKGLEIPASDETAAETLRSVAGGFDSQDVKAYTDQLMQRIEALQKALESAVSDT